MGEIYLSHKFDSKELFLRYYIIKLRENSNYWKFLPPKNGTFMFKNFRPKNMAFKWNFRPQNMTRTYTYANMASTPGIQVLPQIPALLKDNGFQATSGVSNELLEVRACSHDSWTAHCPGATHWPQGQLCLGERSDVSLWLFTWVFRCPGGTSRGGLPIVQHRVTRLVPWVRAFELTRAKIEESRLWGPAHRIQFCQSPTWPHNKSTCRFGVPPPPPPHLQLRGPIGFHTSCLLHCCSTLYEIIVNKQKHSCKFIVTVIWWNCCEQESFHEQIILSSWSWGLMLSSQLLAAAQPWQIASRSDNIERKLLAHFLSTPTKPWSVIAWQSYGRKRKINIQISKYQSQFYKRVTVLALSLEMILRHSCLR